MRNLTQIKKWVFCPIYLSRCINRWDADATSAAPLTPENKGIKKGEGNPIPMLDV